MKSRIISAALIVLGLVLGFSFMPAPKAKAMPNVFYTYTWVNGNTSAMDYLTVDGINCLPHGAGWGLPLSDDGPYSIHCTLINCNSANYFQVGTVVVYSNDSTGAHYDHSVPVVMPHGCQQYQWGFTFDGGSGDVSISRITSYCPCP